MNQPSAPPSSRRPWRSGQVRNPGHGRPGEVPQPGTHVHHQRDVRDGGEGDGVPGRAFQPCRQSDASLQVGRLRRWWRILSPTAFRSSWGFIRRLQRLTVVRWCPWGGVSMRSCPRDGATVPGARRGRRGGAPTASRPSPGCCDGQPLLRLQPPSGDVFADDQNELIVASAEMLYGLIYARYILTTKGLAAMWQQQVPRRQRMTVLPRPPPRAPAAVHLWPWRPRISDDDGSVEAAATTAAAGGTGRSPHGCCTSEVVKCESKSKAMKHISKE